MKKFTKGDFFAYYIKVTEDFCTDPDPLVRGGTDPRIRIRTKMSRIRYTVTYNRRWAVNFDQKRSEATAKTDRYS